MSDVTTAAQEAITCAMLAALLFSGVTTYLILYSLPQISPASVLLLALASVVVSGFLVPHLTAHWIGRPLEDILAEG